MRVSVQQFSLVHCTFHAMSRTFATFTSKVTTGSIKHNAGTTGYGRGSIQTKSGGTAATQSTHTSRQRITQGWELWSMEFEIATRNLSDHQFLTRLSAPSPARTTTVNWWYHLGHTCNRGKCGARVINEQCSKGNSLSIIYSGLGRGRRRGGEGRGGKGRGWEEGEEWERGRGREGRWRRRGRKGRGRRRKWRERRRWRGGRRERCGYLQVFSTQHPPGRWRLWI